ncbi:MAG TPA: phosphatase PAP2 family protein [Stackebrandtia sp.]|uniref:phosphatase PAP2 family protein n=1 Tax=Stackebrandtia sp. TaxID=2023065 RepID=UPI002D728AE4|nr:phosphatase PAP2 family protein [Stackebrandtia sp.]HZE41146.1 phosphatase PAP2 family protein [Stackebrandtia sp.]
MQPQLETTRVVPESSSPGEDDPRRARFERWAQKKWSRFVKFAQATWPIKEKTWRPFGGKPKSWWPDIFLGIGFITNAVLLVWPSPLVKFDYWLRMRMWDIRVRGAVVPWVTPRGIETVQLPGPMDIGHFVSGLGLGRFIAPITVAIAVWAAVRYTSIRPLLFLGGGLFTLGVVLELKNALGRPLSHHPLWLVEPKRSPDGPMLFLYDGAGSAFPSGHDTNTIVFYGLIVLFLGAAMAPWMRRILLLGPPIVVVVSQTFIGTHWLFDAPAGFMIGLLIVRSLRRVPWTTMPLGPLQRFEPPAPRMIAESTVLIIAMLMSATVGRPWGGIMMGVSVTCGLIWLIVRIRQGKFTKVPSQRG